MVVPIVHKSLHEVNFLKNHPLGPHLSVRDIAAYLEAPEVEIESMLRNYTTDDYGGCDQELYWLQNHPLGPKISDNCGSTAKIALRIVWNFFVIVAIKMCDQLPMIKEIFNTIAHSYTRIVDVVSDYASEGYVETKYDESMLYNTDGYYNITNDSSFDESQFLNFTGDAWTTADLSGLDDIHYMDEILVWRNEFLNIFPMPEIVHELYDCTMTSEKHQLNMVLASLETHLACGNYSETATSVLLIRAKHYREWFVKVFPVVMDEFMLNMVYTTELTFDRHIDMMKMALRTKYLQ